MLKIALLNRRTLLPFFLWGALAPQLLHAQTSSLLALAGGGTPEEVQLAIKSGADVNARDEADRTVLMLAAASNEDARVISVLVVAGAKINARGPQGWTALMMAAYGNPNPDVVLALLKAGASGRMRSFAGRTAFDYAQDNEKLVNSQAYTSLKKAQ